MRSLSARIVVAVGLVLAVFLSAAGYALDRAMRDAAASTVRYRLEDQISTLLLLVSFDSDEAATIDAKIPYTDLLVGESGHYAQIVAADGSVFWSSPSTIGLKLPATSRPEPNEYIFKQHLSTPAGKLFELSYTVLWGGGGRLDEPVQFTVPYTIRVFESQAAYDAQVGQFRRTLGTWFFSIVSLLILVQTFILRWGMKPLRTMAAELRAVETGEQDGIRGDYPVELSSLISNLNRLIRTNQANLKRHRNALGDLAHSLKTPLAVLRSTFEAQPPDPVVGDQVAQLEQTINYQLQRAAAAGQLGVGKPVAADEVAERIVSSLRKVYADRDVAVRASAQAGARFFGSQGDLMEIVGNLTDNACKWARSAVSVDLREVADAGDFNRPSLRIRVEDDGPGMPPDYVARALERGARLDQSREGQGIGLAVVRELVEEIYRGTLAIDSCPRGTTVTATLNFD